MKHFVQEKYDNPLLIILAYVGFCISVIAYSPYVIGMEYAYDAVAAEVRGLSFFSMIFFVIVGVLKISDVSASIFSFSINIVFILSSMISLLLLLVNYDYAIYDDFILASMCFVLLIGTSVFFKEKHIKIAFIIYSIISFVVGIQTIIAYGVSFDISDVYLISHKNSICVNWAVCAVGMVFFGLTGKKNVFSVIYFVVTALFLTLILMARGRAAFVAAVLCIIYILLKIYMSVSPQKVMAYLFAGIILVSGLIFLMVHLGIDNFIMTSFLQGRDISDIDNISSGRVVMLYDNIEYIIHNFLFGYAYSVVGNPVPSHMYVLRILVTFGLIGGLPFLVPYFVMMKCILSGLTAMHAQRKFYTWELGYYLAAIVYIVSAFEPAFPLAPKTVTSIVYFMLGVSIRGTVMQMTKAKKFGPAASLK